MMTGLLEDSVAWLRARAAEAAASGAVFGLRGDIESAAVGALCKKAFGERVRGIIMANGPGTDGEDDAGGGVRARWDPRTGASGPRGWRTGREDPSVRRTCP